MRVVRTKHEQALRDAVQQLLADGYNWGQLCGLCLDAMGALDVIDPERTLKIRRPRPIKAQDAVSDQTGRS